ncbi:MAG: phenylalanine--tRNA ligase subunit beta [Bacilli bacterium]|nr:phenylalanine--tRNA ligase subunit beta [Bacilli bacterium]
MLVSLKEVKKYVDLSDLSPEQIADGLTFAGIEVEEVSTLASGTNLVIGHIIECEKHPDSDHLHVLKVDLGPKYGVEQIVCGAPNARKGLKVIVARVGAKLPGGEIKASVIRGVSSNGMCCSLNELGVNPKYLSESQTAGIEELPEDAEVGNEDVLGYLGLDDSILNLKVLANRPDLLSIYNVAREIGAIFSREVNIPSYEVKENFKTDLVVGSETEKCTQFAGRELRDIVIKESPKIMQEALRSMGIRSINNIVDIGNYVMLLTGQPLHMYDKDKLPAHKLIARTDLEGDFVALDEKTYQVKNGDMVISSEGKMMCLGGVMGALECAVDNNTKNIYIEAASFDGATIRRTSSRLGLSSESSQRFVKGTNHFQADEVINFASYLIKEYCDAKECSDIVHYQNEEEPNRLIVSSVTKINKRLGTDFTKEDIKGALERLYFQVKFLDEYRFESLTPKFRLDVSCDADLSEEVIRLLGFVHVKSILPNLDVKVGALSLRQSRVKAIREYLLDQGLDECLTYSLLSKKNAEKFNFLHDEEHYQILNPLTDEREVFRTHIAYSLLEVASYNVSRQAKDLALFETADMISKSSRAEHLSIVLVGNRYLRDLLSQIEYSFYDLKGLVEGVFSILGIEASRFKFERYSSSKEELHPGKSANIIFQNKPIGVFGELHPNAYKGFDFGKNKVFVLEMDLEPLLEAKVTINKMAPISKFPTVSRDLAFIIDKGVPASDIIKVIKVAGKGIVKDVNIFDVYEGSNISPNKKSVAINITLNSDHTLTDKEIIDAMDKIKFELNKKFNIELRM